MARCLLFLSDMQVIARSNLEILPRPRPASGPVEVTLLCADVVGFTPMVEALGDRRALHVMRRLAGLVRSVTSRHRGTQLEARGDSILLSFSTPQSALSCAAALQHALTADAVAHPDEELRMRIAVHTGAALKRGRGYFGRHVILPFRLLSQADAGEIAVSSGAIRRLGRSWQAIITGERTFRPKGFRDEVTFAFADWANHHLEHLAPRAVIAG